MERRQFLAAGGLGFAGGALAVADATRAAGAAPAMPSSSRAAATDDYHFGFTGYDIATTVETDVDDGAPVSFEVTASGYAVHHDGSVVFEVSMTNESSESVQYHSGAPEPFGVLSLRDEDISTWIHPWNDAYAASNHVTTTESRGVGPVASIALSVELDPGETVEERYTLSTATHRIRPGSYEGTVITEVAHDREAEESWRVAADLTVEITPAGDPASPEYERSLTAEPQNDPDFDGRIDVEVLEPITDAHPGLIEVTFTSEWEETRSLRVQRELPFGSYVAEPVDGARLVLQTDDMYAPGFARPDGCWRSAFVPDHFTRRFTTAVDPGERHTLRYVVLGHPDDDCPPAGDYEFTVHYETKGEDSATKEKQAADPGFTLSLGEVPDGYGAAMTPRESESPATSTPDPSSTPAPESPSTATTPERTTDPGTDDPGSTGTEPRDAGTEGDDVRAADRASPESEAQRGLGFGAAVAGLSGWLAARRIRGGGDD